jgi:hypothetical protein
LYKITEWEEYSDMQNELDEIRNMWMFLISKINF